MGAIEIKVDAFVEMSGDQERESSTRGCPGCGLGKDPHGPGCPASADVRLIGDAERTASGGVFIGDTRRVSGVEVSARRPDGRGKFVG